MNLKQAKSKLDNVINKGRVHFYKPFQIAEILRRHRLGEVVSLGDLEVYRNVSRRWRDEVRNLLVGRSSTSSARYQDDIFNENACPPSALIALGKHNKITGGEVEAYVYKMFQSKVSSINSIFVKVKKSTPSTFNLEELVKTFEKEPGLKRSIDKIFEITVYALFSTIVRALQIQVSLAVGNQDPNLILKFDDFLKKVVGFENGKTSLVVDAKLFRLGSTNAADRGLDIIANFGPAIQVKHLTLNAGAIADICEGLTADRIVIVCKDTEVKTVDAIVKQLGLIDRLQSLVTFGDLKRWYKTCLSEEFRNILGENLLLDFSREFANEFPSLDGLADFMRSRGYDSLALSHQWVISED
jgi:type II restriction enzyme